MDKKILLVIIPVLLLGMFSVTKAMTVTELQTQISALQTQIAQLQTQLAQIQKKSTELKSGVKRWAVLLDTQPFSNDPGASLFRDKLIENGWQESHIKILLGKDATYNNFMDALEWLRQNSTQNDIVLIATMSHGASTGISLSDEF